MPDVPKIGAARVKEPSKQKREREKREGESEQSVSTEIRRAREINRDRADSCSAGGHREWEKSTLVKRKGKGKLLD